MKVFITSICLLFFITCDKETSGENTSTNQENIEQTKISRITKKDVEAIDYLDYGLSNATKKAMTTWTGYADLETLIKSIKSGNLSYFESDDEIINAFIKDLKSNVPEKITNQSIIVRITALETKFYKLKSAVKITTIPKKELIFTVKEFLEACSNLNLQMNKKLEKEAQNISKTNL